MLRQPNQGAPAHQQPQWALQANFAPYHPGVPGQFPAPQQPVRQPFFFPPQVPQRWAGPAPPELIAPQEGLQEMRHMMHQIAHQQQEMMRAIDQLNGREVAPEPARRRGRAVISLDGTVPKVIIDDGYVYRYNSRHETHTLYYECWRRHKDSCGARVTIRVTNDGYEVVRRSKEHIGQSCTEEFYQQEGRQRAEVARVKELICSRYVNSRGSLSVDELYCMAIQEFNIGLMNGQFSASVTARTVQKWVSQIRPDQPASSLYELIATRQEAQTNIRHPWLRMADEVFGILIFMTDRQVAEMPGVDCLLIDGSFKSCPQGWSQYLNIMGVKTPTKEYFPIAHILLNGKSEEIYTEALRRWLSFVNDKLTKVAIVTDFEISLREATTKMFRQFRIEAKIIGCLFHFSQAILRKYKEMTRGMQTDRETYQILKIMLFAPFLPFEILTCWTRAVMSQNCPIRALIVYFNKVWLRSYHLWWLGPDAGCMSVLTNCAIEGYHGKVNRAMNVIHPNLERFAEVVFQTDMKVLNKLCMRRHRGEQGNSRAEKFERFQQQKDRLIAIMREMMTLPGANLPRIIISQEEKQEAIAYANSGLDASETREAVHQSGAIWFSND